MMLRHIDITTSLCALSLYVSRHDHDRLLFLFFHPDAGKEEERAR